MGKETKRVNKGALIYVIVLMLVYPCIMSTTYKIQNQESTTELVTESVTESVKEKTIETIETTEIITEQYELEKEQVKQGIYNLKGYQNKEFCIII
jgi:hypothetical protein